MFPNTWSSGHSLGGFAKDQDSAEGLDHWKDSNETSLGSAKDFLGTRDLACLLHGV